MADKTTVILVAHGAPSDPQPQEAVMARLAKAVGALLPDHTIDAATLACPDALEEALRRSPSPAVIYPFFMAEGWFTKRELPRRLTAAGHAGLRCLAPFGVDPALPEMMARTAEDSAVAAGLTLSDATLLLAAHGSRSPGRSADSTYAMAEEMRQRTGFARVTVGFVENAPYLAEAAQGLGPAICLPFFALSAGHVTGDLPDALEKAVFQGPLLPPIGEAEGVPALIAAAIRREVPLA